MENQNTPETEIKENQQNPDKPEAEPADTPEPLSAPEKPKNRKKWLIIGGAGLLVLAAVIVILFLTHVLCIHKWSAATCTQPEICSICDRIQGTPLGHKNDPATCTEDAVCTVCGETVEKAFGHDWLDATCTEPETCSVCGEISGKALGHDWADSTCTTPITCKRCEDTRGAGRHHWELATCTEPKTCTGCGETEGKKLGHDWKDATCTKPQTCRRSDKTKGEAAGHDWVIINYGKPRKCSVCDTTEEMPELPDSATSGLGTGWLMESFYCDIDSDGTNETVGKYLVDSSSAFPVFYRVYDGDYHSDYYGQPGPTAHYDYAMVHDYNTGGTYLALLCKGASGNHGSQSVERYSGQSIVSIYMENPTIFSGPYDESAWVYTCSIKGSSVSYEKACSYISNIKIIDTISDSRDGIGSLLIP